MHCKTKLVRNSRLESSCLFHTDEYSMKSYVIRDFHVQLPTSERWKISVERVRRKITRTSKITINLETDSRKIRCPSVFETTLINSAN